MRPVGSDRTFPVDVRVIAATHKDLHASVKEGAFREDLFYRLNVITMHIPPLSEHKEDVPLLLAHFLKKHARSKRSIERIEGQAMRALMAYDWPGNVRELENTVERALALGQGNSMGLADLPPYLSALAANAAELPASASGAAGVLSPNGQGDILLTSMHSEEQSAADNAPLAPPAGSQLSSVLAEAASNGQNKLDDIEREAILATLRMTGGDRTACAKILGIDKSTLYRKLKRYHFALAADSSESVRSA